jgi:hypothetical protein
VELTDLVEFEAIRQLKHRYMRCVDQKNYVELRACFAPDARTAYGNGEYAFDGRDTIIEFLKGMDRPTLLTCHRVTQPEIELLGPSAARATWALEETCHDMDSHESWHAAAFYTDEYVKIDGHWKISFTGYDRTYEDSRSNSSGFKVRTYS